LIISVIVPTIATLARRNSLLGAIQSLIDQEGGPILPIVVANGDRYDHDLLEELRRDRRIRFLSLEEGNLPRAVTAGRLSVDTEFFGVLDDDDLYLNNAAAVRLAAFRDDPHTDVVVTNGFHRTSDGDILRIHDITSMASDPALTLLTSQWFPTGAAGLFRTSTIGADFLSEVPRGAQWTYVGLRAALTRRIKFVNTCTFVVDTTTPDSMSKSYDYLQEEPEAIKQLMRLNAPRQVRRLLERKYRAAFHELSSKALSERNFRDAWRAHLASLASLHGIRYLSYTRHLVFGPFGVKT
jgi:glycosyltransferase involved in cell wall biosynthesis